MQVKYNTLISNGIWKFVDRLFDQDILIGKWVFKQKQDINGNIKRYKTRWVAQDFEQRKKIDYFDIFAAIIKIRTNKALSAISAKKSYTLTNLIWSSHFWILVLLNVFILSS